MIFFLLVIDCIMQRDENTGIHQSENILISGFVSLLHVETAHIVRPTNKRYGW
jgi:hypothetical protein